MAIPAMDKSLGSDLEFLAHLEEGLPFASIDRVTGAFAPQDREFRYRIILRTTLARFKAEHRRRLSKTQGELVTRLAEVWTDALRVWKTEDEARAFLSRKRPLLEDKRPVDLTSPAVSLAKGVRFSTHSGHCATLPRTVQKGREPTILAGHPMGNLRPRAAVRRPLSCYILMDVAV